ncbi:MAG: hypothetical protein ACXACR_14635 [Candidatus Hodarchaeales archaeon]|jgi:hypothetical protein
MNIEALTYMSLIKSNDKIYRKNAREFKHIFGINLKPYWDNITGFDIVRFDEEFIKSPDGLSMEDVIKDKYNEIGVSIIKSLLGVEL